MKHLIAILLLSATACANHGAQVSVVDDALPYYRTFLSLAKANAMVVQETDLVIRFGDINPAWNAVCVMGGNHTPTITVNASIWSRLPNSQREQLLFHELGHCVLGRQHRTDTINGVPNSIMYPSLVTEFDYQNNRNYYIHELLTD